MVVSEKKVSDSEYSNCKVVETGASLVCIRVLIDDERRENGRTRGLRSSQGQSPGELGVCSNRVGGLALHSDIFLTYWDHIG